MGHSRVIVRRKSRIAFGAVLIAGAITLIASALSEQGDAALIVVVTWCAALTAGWATRVFAAEGPDRDGLGVAGLVVPMIGIALLGPISMHLPFALLGGTRTFDDWVVMSLVCTGPAHLAFAYAGATRAAQLARARPAWSPRTVYRITVIVSCVPFVLLFAIPPILVAFTGLPFLPILHAMEPLAARERDELTRQAHELPFAIVRSA
jgi:hypothetical protein